jgi:hypothetical protein
MHPTALLSVACLLCFPPARPAPPCSVQPTAHILSSFVLPALQLLAVITFQFATGGTSLAPDRSSTTLEKAAAEMDRMLDAFLRWEAEVRGALAARGCWCDAVDPRTGMALRGARGARWSEVAGAGCCFCPGELLCVEMKRLLFNQRRRRCLPEPISSDWPAHLRAKFASVPACSCTCPAGL